MNNAGLAIGMFVFLGLAAIVCITWNQFSAEQDAKEEHIRRTEK